MSIFKAYDIRGKYPAELDEAKAEAIGWAIGQFLSPRQGGANLALSGGKPKKIVVGHDVRVSSPTLTKSLIQGLIASGAEVTDIGSVTTPMSYFADGFYGFDASVMVTASHNPAEYNGFKVCREKAIALSETTGLREIEKIAQGYKRSDPKPDIQCKQLDIREDYKKFILTFLKTSKPFGKLRGERSRTPLKIVVDTANGSVGPIFEYIFCRMRQPTKGLLRHPEGIPESVASFGKDAPFRFIPLYFEPDGRFPNHEPNPMKDENLIALRQAILKEKADLGVGFDGDGDRCMFLDEKGRRIPSDLITCLIAREALLDKPGTHIIYDLRSSWVVREEIERAKGRPVRERVGHTFIKGTMRQHNAVFGGELSGHYYFRENYFADSGIIAFVQFINAVSQENKPVSEIIRPFQRYFASGEINFEVRDKDAKIKEITRVFNDGKQDSLDGITVEYPDWWFNVRKSNTEPLLRLNLEAKTKEQMEKAKQRVVEVIKS